MNLSSFQSKMKKGILVIFLAVVLLITIFIGRNAASTFHFAKASSCAVSKVAAVQVSSNPLIYSLSWETADPTTGKVKWGVTSSRLSLNPKLETAAGKTHNIQFTGADFLTTNTDYYYLIKIGDTMCDSSGQTCQYDEKEEKNGTCVPWSFRTGDGISAGAVKPTAVVSTVTSTIAPTKTVPAATIVPTTADVKPTSSLSAYCQKVVDNLGANSASSNWASVKQYDIDANGIINSRDISACKASGK